MISTQEFALLLISICLTYLSFVIQAFFRQVRLLRDELQALQVYPSSLPKVTTVPLPIATSEPKKTLRKHEKPREQRVGYEYEYEAEMWKMQEQIRRDQERHTVVEIISPFLFLGDRYATYDLAEGLNPWGITRIINVADNFQPPPYPEHLQLITHHFPMHDEYEPNFVAYLLQINEIITLALQNPDKQERILIHCKHGRNRSVATIAGFLLQEGYAYSLPQAMSIIKKRLEKTRFNAVAPRLQYVKTLLKLEPKRLVEIKENKSIPRQRKKIRMISPSPGTHKRLREPSREMEAAPSELAVSQANVQHELL